MSEKKATFFTCGVGEEKVPVETTFRFVSGNFENPTTQATATRIPRIGPSFLQPVELFKITTPGGVFRIFDQANAMLRDSVQVGIH